MFLIIRQECETSYVNRGVTKTKRELTFCWVLWRLGPLAQSQGTPIYYLCRVRLSVRLCVCPSVRTCQRGSHWTDFRENWYGDFYENL